MAAEKDAAARSFIEEWLAAHAPTSYEFAVGANKPGTTDTAMKANGINVTVLPDEYVEQAAFDAIVAKLSGGKGSAHTKGITVYDPKWRPDYVTKRGRVSSVRATKHELKLKTVYPRGISRLTQSGYGVGTREDADVKTGRSTLAHHEGAHAACFVLYVQEHAPPAFTGSVGDTAGEAANKDKTFQAAMDKYYADMAALCGPSVDCAGTKAPFCP